MRHSPHATRYAPRAAPPDAILARMQTDRRLPEPAHLGRARGAVAYSFLVHGVMFGAWASRIPAIKDQTGLDSTHLGFALLAASAGAVLAMSFAGVLAGRFGSHVVTVAMLLGYAAFVPTLALANSFVTLTAALLFVALPYAALMAAFPVASPAAPGDGTFALTQIPLIGAPPGDRVTVPEIVAPATIATVDAVVVIPLSTWRASAVVESGCPRYHCSRYVWVVQSW